MRFVALLFLLISVALARPPKWNRLTRSYTHDQYVSDMNKRYHSAEEKGKRAKIFQQNLKTILKHNHETHSWKMGINQFTDMTETELKALRGAKYEPTYAPKYRTPYTAKGLSQGDGIDYRLSVPPVLTGIKDQGACGDCWAHSVTEAIESSYAITTGLLFVLSQQQVTSCTPQTGSCYSCNGSFPSLAYDYVAENGLTEEWVYPFEAYNGSFPSCRKDPIINWPVQTFVNITGFIEIGRNNQYDMIDALHNLGPLGILVDASKWSFYETGVFDSCDYAMNISLDHAVNVVGYGHDSTLNVDYWIVRNSWAPSWGENGFIRLHKADTPSCGWNVGAAYSSDCYGVGPSAVWTCGQCGILFNPTFPTVSAPTPVPATPAPAPNSYFVQMQCQNAACSTGCTNYSFPQNQCLGLGSGGSAIAQCQPSSVVLTEYNSTDCSGTGKQDVMQLETCLAGGAIFFENYCPGQTTSPVVSPKVFASPKKLQRRQPRE